MKKFLAFLIMILVSSTASAAGLSTEEVHERSMAWIKNNTDWMPSGIDVTKFKSEVTLRPMAIVTLSDVSSRLAVSVDLGDRGLPSEANVTLLAPVSVFTKVISDSEYCRSLVQGQNFYRYYDIPSVETCLAQKSCDNKAVADTARQLLGHIFGDLTHASLCANFFPGCCKEKEDVPVFLSMFDHKIEYQDIFVDRYTIGRIESGVNQFDILIAQDGTVLGYRKLQAVSGGPR